MSKTITWLHISDLHTYTPETGWDVVDVLEFLLKDLKKMEKEYSLRPDLIFFTGDATFGHVKPDTGYTIPDQFNDAQLFFEDVRAAYSPKVPPENLFLVPGNHEVNRSEVLESQTFWLDHLVSKEKSADKINHMIQHKNNEWKTAMKRLKNYRDSLNRTNYKHLLQDPDRLIYAHTREINGLKIGVIGLNSAWSCFRDSIEEKGKLWMGGRWQINTLFQGIKNSDIKLALIHHPIKWFTVHEDPKLEQLAESKLNFLLYGHEHDARVTPKGDSHLQIAAGAVYGESESESGYNFVRLDFEAGKGEIWLRKYTPEGGGGWIPCIIPGKTDEKGMWTIERLPGKLAVEKEVVSKPSAEVDESEKECDSKEKENGPEVRGIYGRSQYISKLVVELKKTPIITIYGMAGIGKTALLTEVARAFDNIKIGRIIVHPKTNMAALYPNLAFTLGSRDDYPSPPITLLGSTNFSAIEKLAGNARRMIIHLDRAHELINEESGFHDPLIEELLRSIVKANSNIKIVMECRETPPEGMILGELNNRKLHKAFKLRGLGREAITEFFRRPFNDRPGTAWDLTEEDAEKIFNRLGGDDRRHKAHPLGMQLLASLAEDLKKTPMEIMERHPKELNIKLEDELFHDLYDNVLSEAERHVLRLCALYRESIPSRHIMILSRAAKAEDAFERLVSRCLLTADDAGKQYDLHQMIAGLVRSRSEKERGEWKSDHETIASAWLQDVKTATHPTLYNIHITNEAVYHITEAERYDLLDKLSTDLLNFIELLDQLSDKLYKKKRHKERLSVLRLLFTIDPGNPKTHRFLGSTMEKINGRGNDEALEHYLNAYKLAPDYPANLANLGRSMIARKEPKRFIEIVDSLEIKQRKERMDAYNLTIYFKCLENAGKKEKASELRQKEINAGSIDVVYYTEEANYLLNQDKPKEALELLDRAEKLGIGDEYALAIRASVLKAKGDDAGASILRQKEIHAGSHNVAFYNDEANYLINQNKPKEALELLDKAEKLGIGDEFTIAIRILVLKAKGDDPGASILRQKEINAGSIDVVYYTEEANYLLNQDKPKEALELLDRAEKLGIGNEYTKSLRFKILKALG